MLRSACGDLVRRNRRTADAGERRPPRPASPPRRILVVDDSPLMLLAVGIGLDRPDRWAVTTTDSGPRGDRARRGTSPRRRPAGRHDARSRRPGHAARPAGGHRHGLHPDRLHDRRRRRRRRSAFWRWAPPASSGSRSTSRPWPINWTRSWDGRARRSSRARLGPASRRDHRACRDDRRAVAALATGDLDDDARRTAARAAHRLAGTAGTFGFAPASEHAAALDLALRAPPGPGDAAELARLALALRDALDLLEEPAPDRELSGRIANRRPR